LFFLVLLAGCFFCFWHCMCCVINCSPLPTWVSTQTLLLFLHLRVMHCCLCITHWFISISFASFLPQKLCWLLIYIFLRCSERFWFLWKHLSDVSDYFKNVFTIEKFTNLLLAISFLSCVDSWTIHCNWKSNGLFYLAWKFLLEPGLFCWSPGPFSSSLDNNIVSCHHVTCNPKYLLYNNTWPRLHIWFLDNKKIYQELTFSILVGMVGSYIRK